MKKNRILILILVLAAILRLWKLSSVPVSLFGDELDVGYQAYSILKTGRDYYGNFMPIHFHSLAEWRTPFYLYSVVPTVAMFGISPLGVRLPAAIFGIGGVWALYLLVLEMTRDRRIALISSFVLAISPWHIQYSRAAFEVSELLFFLILGLYFFLKAMKKGQWFWVSAVFLALTPWIYSTAKFFTPLLLTFLVLVWGKQIFSLRRKYLVWAIMAFVLIGAPIAYSTVFGGGTERFGYISVFSDPTTESEVGTARQNDARVRGEMGEGLSPTLIDRSLHNKFVYWGGHVLKNYLQPFSSDFLFIRGDPNLRHSIEGMGEFYVVDAAVLLVGLILIYGWKIEKRYKYLILFWIFAGVIPASITRDGGNHATRLILILPPLVLIVSYGISMLSRLWLFVYGVLLLVCFVFYQHNFWYHNPWYSERWWHAGFEQSVHSVRELQGMYDTVLISTANEPPWVFFAAWYEYPPREWQLNFPIGNDVELANLGKVSHIDKFYFGSLGVGLYDMGKVLNSTMLYMASAKEVNVNLIAEPERVPDDLVLLKAIAYPSGEPAFYLFSGR